MENDNKTETTPLAPMAERGKKMWDDLWGTIKTMPFSQWAAGGVGAAALWLLGVLFTPEGLGGFGWLIAPAMAIGGFFMGTQSTSIASMFTGGGTPATADAGAAQEPQVQLGQEVAAQPDIQQPGFRRPEYIKRPRVYSDFGNDDIRIRNARREGCTAFGCVRDVRYSPEATHHSDVPYSIPGLPRPLRTYEPHPGLFRRVVNSIF